MDLMINILCFPVFIVALVFFSTGAWADADLVSETSRAFRSTSAASDLTPTADDPGSLEPAKQTDEPRSAAEVKIDFEVKRILIEGLPQNAEASVRSLISTHENSRMTLSQLESLASKITALMYQKGFVTSYAYIPEQKILDGQVLVRVVVGRIGQISVEGNRWFNERIYLDAVGVKSGDEFRMAELERSVRNIAAQPDRAASLHLRPGSAPETLDVILKAKDHFPAHVSYEYNRRGSNLTHYSRHILGFNHNNLLGGADRLTSYLTLAEDHAVLSGYGRYDVPIERTGTLLSFDASEARTTLQKHLEDLDVQGRSVGFSAGLSQRVWRNGFGTAELDGDFRFRLLNSKSVRGAVVSSEDKPRVISGGPSLTLTDAGGRTQLGSQVHVGIPEVLGGSGAQDGLSSRLDAGGEFIYGTAQATRIQRIAARTFAILQFQGQWSHDPLPSTDLFYAGGMYSVRGYPESDSSGDHGFFYSAELDFAPIGIPTEWTVPGRPDVRIWDALNWCVFWDGAMIYNKLLQTPTSNETRSLLGTGFGARMRVGENVSLRADVGFPVGDASIGKDNLQVHLSCRIST
jgi:hemolysin activation/secretion protein